MGWDGNYIKKLLLGNITIENYKYLWYYSWDASSGVILKNYNNVKINRIC